MEGEFKVRAVDFEEKSVQELETELVEQHQQELVEQQQETQVEAPVETNVEPQDDSHNHQEFEINDDLVVSHIRNKYNKEVNSLDELFQPTTQQELDEEVEAFNRYKRETGRGLEDFIKLNRDLDKVDPNTLLADFYRDNGDDDEDIEYKLGKLSYDEDLDDEDDIREKKLQRKQELKKAKSYFESLKEQYKTPLESSRGFVPESDKEEFEDFKAYKSTQAQQLEDQQKKSQYFKEKTDELFSKFEGFGYNIDDNTKIVYKPGEASELKERQSNLNNFISKFLTEDGYLKDAELFHKAIAMAIEPDKTAKFFYEKGKADAITDLEKESKQIDMTRGATSVTPKSGFNIRVVEDGYDGRLKIKKR